MSYDDMVISKIGNHQAQKSLEPVPWKPLSIFLVKCFRWEFSFSVLGLAVFNVSFNVLWNEMRNVLKLQLQKLESLADGKRHY